MKRIVCVFFAAVMAATFCFTQELNFDGYVNSGLGLWKSDETNNNNPMIMVYGVDSERYIGQFRLNGAYTNAEKNAGANFRLQVQGRGFDPSSTTDEGVSGSELPHAHSVNLYESPSIPSLAFGYGWVKFLNVFIIKAGLVDDSTWQTSDFIYNDDQSEGVGILLKLSHEAGLDIGFGGYVATYNSNGNNNFLDVDLPSQIKLNKAKYTFNLSYTMDKVFRIMVSGRTSNETGGDVKYNTSHFLGEFSILALDELTAVVVAETENHNDDENNKDINLYETLGYNSGTFGIGLNAAQYLRNLPERSAKNKNFAFASWFNPWISYGFKEGKVVTRLDFVYIKGGYQDGENYHRRGFMISYDQLYKQYTGGYNGETFVFNFRPSITINIDSRTSLEIGDSIYYSNADRSNGTKGDTVTTNVAYIDMVVKF